MGIIVDHDKRRKAILKKAIEVFVDEGYEDATFQKIANRCGITRTTLYIYFQNKREIFLYSIKQLTEGLESSIKVIISDANKSSKDKLLETLECIVHECVKNKDLFGVILAYLIQLKQTGNDPQEKVRRRIVRLRHLLSAILIKGIDKGEFKKINVKAANEMFYSLIEASIFRLVIINQSTVELLESIELAVNGISIE